LFIHLNKKHRLTEGLFKKNVLIVAGRRASQSHFQKKEINNHSKHISTMGNIMMERKWFKSQVVTFNLILTVKQQSTVVMPFSQSAVWLTWLPTSNPGTQRHISGLGQEW
jgi:aspartyl aminopeptidase